MSALDHLVAYNMAVDILKQAGFVLNNVSNRSESCYYYHPSRGKKFLLRVSTHKSKRCPMGLKQAVAKVTFSRKDLHCYEHTVKNKLIMAVGRYFLAEEIPSRYKGRRGTWEEENVGCDQF